MKKIVSFVFPLSIAAFVFSFGFTAFAAVGGKPANPLRYQSPNWFVYQLDNGESYRDVLEVQNTGDSPALIQLYAVDGLSHYPSEDFLLKDIHEEMSEIGAWITLDEDVVFVPPHSSVNVGFTIAIPNEGYPYEYIRTTGAILMEDVSYSLSNEYSGGIALSTRSGVRIYNTLPH